MSEIKRGKYIVFEGGECTGKSTQSKMVAERIDAQWVREPGQTPLGAHLRAIMLDPSIEATGKSLAFLFAADRSQVVDEVIEPTTASGRHVVSDRSWRSSYAYQSAQGVDGELTVAVNQLAIGSYTEPDLLILLDGDPEELAQRRMRDNDRFENMEFDFHHKVREGLLEICQGVGAVTIDATMELEEVTEAIWAAVEPIVGE
jgi:dTMP kinase